MQWWSEPVVSCPAPLDRYHWYRCLFSTQIRLIAGFSVKIAVARGRIGN